MMALDASKITHIDQLKVQTKHKIESAGADFTFENPIRQNAKHGGRQDPGLHREQSGGLPYSADTLSLECRFRGFRVESYSPGPHVNNALDAAVRKRHKVH